ncbi:unnamed protein product [Cylindrotheca closterium]|uniref:Uncharacterized protein n=1 Tax=Cylindrotheca closterium TaxID=2856 RepID=A0AAD2CFK8_9STRA|nr:unnamed protein product [Cylindrotheca closterium]
METQQKKVTFHNRVKRRFVERVPRKERSNLWYSKSEYAEARERERVLRSSISHQDYSEIAYSLSVVGIVTREQMAMKSIMVDNSIKAVLDEQEKQEDEANEYNDDPDTTSELDHEEIAQEYYLHSTVSLTQAQNRARCLAQHVKDIESQQKDEESLATPPPPPPPPRRQVSSNNRSTRSSRRSPPPLGKNKMALVRRRTQYGRPSVDVPQVVKCTTPAA